MSLNAVHACARRARPRWLAVLALALAAAGARAAEEPLARWYTDDHVAAGAPLYREHCARCHGARGEGAPAWRRRDADGRFPAPPLDGTGHTWHHPIDALLTVIAGGSPGGQGNMPAWRDVLSAEQMATLIAHFQHWWPEEVYRAWLDIERRARR